MSENNKSDQAQAVPLVDPERDAGPAQELMLARAAAIQGYANIEQSMSILFAFLLATYFEIAGIVFFRIVNTRSRMVILQDLLKKRHEDKYHTFWDSFAKIVQGMDSKRNEIIHWHVVHNLDIGEKPKSTFTLAPPNFWRKPSGNAITPADLNEFSGKCDFVSRLLGMFSMMISGRLTEDIAKSWIEIFQQPIIYPPPSNHPLYPTSQAP